MGYVNMEELPPIVCCWGCECGCGCCRCRWSISLATHALWHSQPQQSGPQIQIQIQILPQRYSVSVWAIVEHSTRAFPSTQENPASDWLSATPNAIPIAIPNATLSIPRSPRPVAFCVGSPQRGTHVCGHFFWKRWKSTCAIANICISPFYLQLYNKSQVKAAVSTSIPINCIQ